MDQGDKKIILITLGVIIFGGIFIPNFPSGLIFLLLFIFLMLENESARSRKLNKSTPPPIFSYKEKHNTRQNFGNKFPNKSISNIDNEEEPESSEISKEEFYDLLNSIELVSDDECFDFDDNEYSSFKLGNFFWSTSNFRGETFSNGDKIYKASSKAEWINFCIKKIPAYSFYDFKSNGTDKYYNFYAVNNQNEIAKYGWGIPKSNAEIDLTTTLMPIFRSEEWYRKVYRKLGIKMGGFINQEKTFELQDEVLSIWIQSENNKKISRLFIQENFDNPTTLKSNFIFDKIFDYQVFVGYQIRLCKITTETDNRYDLDSDNLDDSQDKLPF